MDPINNPTPTPNPAPVVPETPVQPVADSAPATAPIAPAAPVQPMPSSAPVPPAMQNAPVQPAVNPTPITINPGQAHNAIPAEPFNPAGGGLVGATDPITMPAPPKAPDPVEEELKAPFKAAGPVPGSIGSAISMPADAPVPDAGRTPNNVSFTDPAMSQPMTNPATMQPAKKKTSKGTLIALAVIAGLIVVILAAYLVMTLMQGQ